MPRMTAHITKTANTNGLNTRTCENATQTWVYQENHVSLSREDRYLVRSTFMKFSCFKCTFVHYFRMCNKMIWYWNKNLTHFTWRVIAFFVSGSSHRLCYFFEMNGHVFNPIFEWLWLSFILILKILRIIIAVCFLVFLLYCWCLSGNCFLYGLF